MPDQIQQLKDELARSRQRLNIVFDQVGDRWGTQVYAEGAQWTIQQLAIHLVIADDGHNRMAMGAAEGHNIIPEDYDLNRYNRRSVEKRAQKTLDEIRADLAESRARLLAWFDEIDEAVLEREGRYGNLEMLPAGEILRRLAGHELTHANDIASVLNIE